MTNFKYNLIQYIVFILIQKKNLGASFGIFEIDEISLTESDVSKLLFWYGRLPGALRGEGSTL